MPDYLAGLGRRRRAACASASTARFNYDGVDADMAAVVDAARQVFARPRRRGRRDRDARHRRDVEGWAPFCAVETAVAHEATYPARAAEYGPALAGLIELGRGADGAAS